MPSLMNVPGLGGYIQGQQLGQQQAIGQLQQAQGLMGILSAVQQQQAQQAALESNAQLRGALAQSGGDLTKAMQAAIASGNLQGAAKLAPLIEAQRKANLPQGVSIGSGGLLTSQGIIPPAARPTPPPTPTNLARLTAERDALPADSPLRATYDNAIRKESETAKQISPTVVVPRNYPIVNTSDGIFERRPEGLVQLKDPNTGLPLKPGSLTSGTNQQALALRRDYNANPQVKLANALEPRVGPVAQYVAEVGKGMGNSVGDAELVKLWLMTTHPKGDQISNMDYRSIEKMPDLYARIKNVAGNFVFGKTLDADTRASMWRSISEKFKATAQAREKYKADVIGRGKNMGIDQSLLFPPAE